MSLTAPMQCIVTELISQKNGELCLVELLKNASAAKKPESNYKMVKSETTSLEPYFWLSTF
jgi:hypothetical protein